MIFNKLITGIDVAYVDLEKLQSMRNNRQKQRVAIIGTVGLPANYGGFETLTKHLVENIEDRYDLTVYCSKSAYPKETRKRHYRQSRLIYLPFKANGIQSIIYDTLSILHALFYADVLLVLGVAGAWIFPWIRLFTGKKIIVSIDGIEWKRDKWNLIARMYLWWVEKIAVKFSHIDISDNEGIQNYTALRYGSLSRIVEYGADHVMTVDIEEKNKIKYPFLNDKYAFGVCRIEPENNVSQILEACATNNTLPLVMVGNWHSSAYGKDLIKKYRGHTGLYLLDAIYDQQELDLLRSNCYLYVHGHSAGGTNPSLVEAMYLGLPIACYDVIYNRVTTENQALYFNDSKELIDIIKNNGHRDMSLVATAMKEIAMRRYTWKHISSQYENLIKDALTEKSKPSIIPKISTTEVHLLLTENVAHLKHQKLIYEFGTKK